MGRRCHAGPVSLPLTRRHNGLIQAAPISARPASPRFARVYETVGALPGKLTWAAARGGRPAPQPGDHLEPGPAYPASTQPSLRGGPGLRRSVLRDRPVPTRGAPCGTHVVADTGAGE